VSAHTFTLLFLGIIITGIAISKLSSIPTVAVIVEMSEVVYLVLWCQILIRYEQIALRTDGQRHLSATTA
jgi:hypothetical protein